MKKYLVYFLCIALVGITVSCKKEKETVKNEPVKVNTPSIDARLLKFKFIKVNRQVWYTEKNDTQAPVSEDAAA